MGEPPENDVSITPELVGEDEVGELFQGLRSTIRIQLWRKKPTWCAGFLVSIDLSPGEMLMLIAALTGAPASPTAASHAFGLAAAGRFLLG